VSGIPSIRFFNPSRRRGGVRGFLLFVLIAAIMVGSAAWKIRYGTYHLATVQEGALYRDGSRSVRELSTAVQKVHAKTVVSLIDDAESRDPSKPQFQQEADYLAARHIQYQRIPVKLGGWPTSDDLQQFLHTMEQPGQRPVLLHCAQGVRRTAMFVAAYQESVLGYDKQRAKAAILSFGHSDRTVADIEHFIDLYDPKARTVPPDLGKMAAGKNDNVTENQH